MTLDLLAQLQATLGEAYTVERELGGGGMSRVFLAEERALGRKVVVKVLAPELAADVSFDRFAREIRMTAQLQHPQIVPVLATGETCGLPYYTMPYVAGESLRARIDRHGALPIAEAVAILRDVTKALDYAHSQGVAHRDIKPANVLLAHNAAMVADFGIGKALSASTVTGGTQTLTRAGAGVGTPAYMAPEQATGEGAVDHRADIYAFGSMAYELLVGAPPFAGLSSHESIVALLSRPPEPIGAKRPDVPEALAALVMRCLAKSPADRPQTAADVLIGLDEMAVPSRSPPAPLLVPPPQRRTLWTVTSIVAVGAVVLLVAGAAVAALRAVRARAGDAGPAAAAAAELRSVAVVPFVNVGGDTATEFFSDGITGELISSLSRIGGLRVAPRTSSFAFKGRNAGVREIGERLRVAAVLAGTARRVGDRVRITAELASVSGDSIVWSGSFDAALGGIGTLQDSIMGAVLSRLGARQAAATVGRSGVSGDTAAYLLYLKGRFLWNQRTPASMRLGIELLEQAIARDGNYARAYAGLAMAHALSPAFGDVAPSVARPKARNAAARAVALDSLSPEAHTALGVVSLFYDQDFNTADAHLLRASALDRSDATPHLFRAWVLCTRGKLDEALAEVRVAQRLDPLSVIVNARVGSLLFWQRRSSEAVAELRKVLELDPTNVLPLMPLSDALASLGRYEEAIAVAPKVSGLEAGTADGRLALTYAAAGRRASVQSVARGLDSFSTRHWVSPLARAVVALANGDKPSALDWVERAEREHDFYLVFLACEPSYDELRGEPRMRAILQRMGITDSWPNGPPRSR